MSELTGLTLTDAALKRLRKHEWVLSCVHPLHQIKGLRRRLADQDTMQGGNCFVSTHPEQPRRIFSSRACLKTYIDPCSYATPGVYSLARFVSEREVRGFLAALKRSAGSATVPKQQVSFPCPSRPGPTLFHVARPDALYTVGNCPQSPQQADMHSECILARHDDVCVQVCGHPKATYRLGHNGVPAVRCRCSM